MEHRPRAVRPRGGRRPATVAAVVATVVAVLCPAVLASWPAVAAAAPAPAPAAGDPTRVDPSFGGGFATHNLSDIDDQAAAMALQADGAVVVVGVTNTEPFDHTPGDIFVARFTPAGELDPTFGSGGVAVIGAPGEWDWASAVAIQGDGNIVIAGAVNSQPTILRLLPSGVRDPLFLGGTIPPLDGGNTYVEAVAIQPDGKIVFTGNPVAVGRLNAVGTADTTFGTNGMVATATVPGSTRSTTYRGIVVQPDGRIVVGGSTDGAAFTGPVEFASLARFTSSGEADASFGTDGLVTTDLDTNYTDRGTKIYGLALQPDGRIVAAGQVYSWATQGSPGPNSTPSYGPIRHLSLGDVALFRYLPNGQLDPDFAGNGTVITRLTSQTDPSQGTAPGPLAVPEVSSKALAVSLAPGGAILVTGTIYELQGHPLVLRYTPSGLLDTTFGRGGALVVDLGALGGEATAMALQPDGRVVVAGSTRTGLVQRGSYWDLMVGRVIPGTSAGTVWTWGWNAVGQLGDGTTTDRHAPAEVPGLTGVVGVSAGAYHTLALRGDGTVWAWGYNAVGELGDGTTANRLRPVQVPGLTGMVAVSAGGLHSLALRGDGTVWSWGWNGFGQLGDATTTMHLSPVRVPGLVGIGAISAGLYHSFAIREDGGALAWGYNAVGQLGDGTTADRHSPVWLHLMPSGYAYHQISAGSLHSLAVGVNASIQGSGWNGLAQIGNPSLEVWVEPGQPLPQVAHAVSAGWYHSLVIQNNGSVLSGGWNVMGQLGDGTTSTHQWAAVPGLTQVAAVSAGGVHSLALTEDRRLLAWGWNVVGQLGTGTTSDARSPTSVGSLTNVVAASAGYLHSAAIRG